MNEITAGRLLRANTRGCVVGCNVRQSPPDFGAMVNIPIENGRIFGLIYDIHIDDDGLVRQLAAAENISEEIILDNRLNRNTPVEMSILFIGYEQNGRITHRLPPKPPLSLDNMLICIPEDVCLFSSTGNFGYFRHILTDPDLPIADLAAAHLLTAFSAQPAQKQQVWKSAALDMIITLLRDDHDLLNQVLFAISDAFATRAADLEEN